MKIVEEISDSVECSQCRNRMRLIKIKKHSGGWPVVILVSGLFSCFFFFGALVGIPLILLGIYMIASEETISHCPNCGHYFKALVIKKESL
jgi:DNA-directed RNA polymerase subunit RPC12/RpoP